LHIGKGNVDLFLAPTTLYVHNTESKGKEKPPVNLHKEQERIIQELDWPNNNA